MDIEIVVPHVAEVSKDSRADPDAGRKWLERECRKETGRGAH